MQEVKVITARACPETFQSNINRAIKNGWQLGQLSTCVNGGAVIFTMVMTKETADVSGADDNVPQALATQPKPIAQKQSYSQWDDPGQSFYDK